MANPIVSIQEYASSRSTQGDALSSGRYVGVVGYVIAGNEANIVRPSITVTYPQRVAAATQITAQEGAHVRIEVRRSIEHTFEKFAADFTYLADK